MTRVRHDHKHNADDIFDFDTQPPEPIEGSAQAVSLLGPYHVSATTEGPSGTGDPPATLGSTNGYIAVCDLPDGCVVLNAWAEPTVSFNTPTSKITIDIQPTDDPDHSSDISSSWSTQVDETSLVTFRVSNAAAAGRFVARAVTNAQLMVYLAGGASTTGEADIYALIATPV